MFQMLEGNKLRNTNRNLLCEECQWISCGIQKQILTYLTLYHFYLKIKQNKNIFRTTTMFQTGIKSLKPNNREHANLIHCIWRCVKIKIIESIRAQWPERWVFAFDKETTPGGAGCRVPRVESWGNFNALCFEVRYFEMRGCFLDFRHLVSKGGKVLFLPLKLCKFQLASLSLF